MPQTSPMDWMLISITSMTASTLMASKKVIFMGQNPSKNKSTHLSKIKKWTW